MGTVRTAPRWPVFPPHVAALVDETRSAPSAWPPGHNSLAPGRFGMEVSFSSLRPDAARLCLQPYATSLDARVRRARSVEWMLAAPDGLGARTADLVDRWSPAFARAPRYGAFLGCELDERGCLEVAKLYVELAPDVASHELPVPGATEALVAPFGLRPEFVGFSADRTSALARLYLSNVDPVPTRALLRHLDRAIGPDAERAELVDRWVAAGTDGTDIAPGRLVIGLRTARGIEVTLDLMGFRDDWEGVGALAEAVGCRAGLDRWRSRVGAQRGRSVLRLGLTGAHPTMSVYVPVDQCDALGNC